MNMIRARVVKHPQEWRQSGYHELCGDRQRYKLLDRNKLIRCLGHFPKVKDTEAQFVTWYQRTLMEKLENEYIAKETDVEHRVGNWQ